MKPKNDPHRATLDLQERANQKARLSASLVEQSGLNSRIRGHVSARVRRSQAARAGREQEE